MALFFRKSRSKVDHASRGSVTTRESSSVSRETLVKLPTGPKRAAFDRADDDWGLDLDDEYGIEVEPDSPALALPVPQFLVSSSSPIRRVVWGRPPPPSILLPRWPSVD